MNASRRSALSFSLLILSIVASIAQPSALAVRPPVISPPETFFEFVNPEDRDVARHFYKKYIDVQGMPVAASAEVDDLALQRTYAIVTRLLAGRPDILEALIKNRMYLIIIGKDQVYTDMPECAKCSLIGTTC